MLSGAVSGVGSSRSKDKYDDAGAGDMVDTLTEPWRRAEYKSDQFIILVLSPYLARIDFRCVSAFCSSLGRWHGRPIHVCIAYAVRWALYVYWTSCGLYIYIYFVGYVYLVVRGL